jgi:hypothetical protein
VTETMTEAQKFSAWKERVQPTARTRKREWGIRERDLDLRLATLKPFDGNKIPLQKQQQIIDTVRTRINEGWAFFGLPGTGKTTLSNCLFHQAVMRRLLDEETMEGVLPASLWRITARALCQQAQDRATHSNDSADDFMFGDPGEMFRAQQRVVSRERIERAHKAGLTPSLFIEEWDKVGLTDFRRETLFDILDCMYNVNGQLVITSNLTWPEFCSTFGGTSWRLNKICNICRIEDVKEPEIIAKEA